MTPSNFSLDQKTKLLKDVRSRLLKLHKALLDSERGIYEQIYEPIQSTGEFFQLVLGHEWFSWLRPISQFIARVDDALDPKTDPVDLAQVDSFLAEARTLVHPAEGGTPAEMRYFDAIQRDPNITLMHADIVNLLEGKGA
ncbi:MAG: hypothetical protein AAF651_06370 [Cyanobacteria bacterium P01_C01_bin.73]